MPEPSIDSVLQNFFLKSSRADWKKIAMHETHGEDPFNVLSWRGKDDLVFSPYYDAADVAELPFLNDRPLPVADRAASQNWTNLPAVNALSERTANAEALEHLMNGADGILFDLRKSTDTDLNTLLANIQWPFCTLTFDVDEGSHIEDKLRVFLEHAEFDLTSVTGALFWESIPKNKSFQFYHDNCSNLRSMGFAIPGATPAEEISGALIEGVKTLDAFESDQARALRSICFSVTADASVLETAAKINALRLLWRQVAHAYGHTDYNAEDLYIHARSKAAGDGLYGPHENMLKGTFTALAAVLGGCSALTVMTFTNAAFVSRWARNVSLILQEESFFNRVASPLAGSYTFEVMVDAIAQKAWRHFQQKCSTL